MIGARYGPVVLHSCLPLCSHSVHVVGVSSAGCPCPLSLLPLSNVGVVVAGRYTSYSGSAPSRCPVTFLVPCRTFGAWQRCTWLVDIIVVASWQKAGHSGLLLHKHCESIWREDNNRFSSYMMHDGSSNVHR